MVVAPSANPNSVSVFLASFAGATDRQSRNYSVSGPLLCSGHSLVLYLLSVALRILFEHRNCPFKQCWGREYILTTALKRCYRHPNICNERLLL